MQTITETVCSDALHVVEPRAAGLDVHKLQVTASIRLCDPGGGPPASATREFGTTPAGLCAMTDLLLENGVEAAALEAGASSGRRPTRPAKRPGSCPRCSTRSKSRSAIHSAKPPILHGNPVGWEASRDRGRSVCPCWQGFLRHRPLPALHTGPDCAQGAAVEPHLHEAAVRRAQQGDILDNGGEHALAVGGLGLRRMPEAGEVLCEALDALAGFHPEQAAVRPRPAASARHGPDRRCTGSRSSRIPGARRRCG